MTTQEGHRARDLAEGLRAVIERFHEMDEQIARTSNTPLSETELAALRAIGEAKLLRMRALSEALRISAPYATGLVARLEGFGLVQRRHDIHDRRAVNVELTPRGEEIRTLSEDEAERFCAAFLSNLSDDEQVLIVRAIAGLGAKR